MSSSNNNAHSHQHTSKTTASSTAATAANSRSTLSSAATSASTQSQQTAGMMTLTENQRKAQQYLKDHRIEELLSDMLNTIAHNQYDQPILYMIKYLAKQLPENMLLEHGISVQMTHGSSSSNGERNSEGDLSVIMSIQYPQFDATCNNIFRQALTHDVYAQCKGLQTPFKNNLRHLIALGLENPKHKVGLFATDAACYNVFRPLFSFADNAIFSAKQEVQQEYADEMLRAVNFNSKTSLNQEFKFFEEFSIKMKRNLSAFPFNTAMTSAQRQQVAETITETLEEQLPKLFIAHCDLETMSVDERMNLVVQYNKFIKENSSFTRAANLRFKDWPDNRRIIMSANKKYLVWINREDHFELRCCSSGRESNFFESLIQSAKITEILDEKIGFSFDKQHGFHCVKPASAGLATKFKIKVKLPSAHQATFKSNIEQLKKSPTPSPLFDIKSTKKDSSRWIISFNKSYSLNWTDLVDATEKYIRSLFRSITDKNQQTLVLNPIHLDTYSINKSVAQKPSSSEDTKDFEDQSTSQPNGTPETNESTLVSSSPQSKQQQLSSSQQQQSQQQQQRQGQPPKPVLPVVTNYARKQTADNQKTPIKQNTQSNKNASNNGQAIKPDHIEILIEDENNKMREDNAKSNNTSGGNGVMYQPLLGQSEADSLSISSKELSGIIMQANPCVVLQSYSTPKEHILNSYLILRRNFKDIPLKSMMADGDFRRVNSILASFGAALNEDYTGGQMLSPESSVFEEEVKSAAGEFGLLEDSSALDSLIDFDGSHFPLGTFYFKSKNLRVLGNYADHLTVILQITCDDIIECLIELHRIVAKINTTSYRCDSKFGYLTVDPIHSGSGLSIVYRMSDKSAKESVDDGVVSSSSSSSNSQVKKKRLESEKAIQVELNAVEHSNLSEFVAECNRVLLQIKVSEGLDESKITKNHLSEVDCFDAKGVAIAPARECYDLHRKIYESFVRSSSCNLKASTLGASYMPSTQVLKFKDISQDVKVTYELRRNFSAFDFTKFMTNQQVNALHSHFEAIFKKIPSFHLKQGHQYKTRCYTHNDRYFLVDVMKNDHVGIFSFGKLKELAKSLNEAFELLQLFQCDGGMSFLYDDKLGYLSESGQRLGDNFYLKLEMALTSAGEIAAVTKLAKEYKYELMSSAQVGNSCSSSSNSNITLELKRCGYFIHEMEFLQRLAFALSEKKESRKD